MNLTRRNLLPGSVAGANCSRKQNWTTNSISRERNRVGLIARGQIPAYFNTNTKLMALNDMTSQLSLNNTNVIPSVSFLYCIFQTSTRWRKDIDINHSRRYRFRSSQTLHCVFQKYCGVELELNVEVTPTCSKLSRVGERKMHLLRLFRSTSEDVALSQIPHWKCCHEMLHLKLRFLQALWGAYIL